MAHGRFSADPETRWLTESGTDRLMKLLQDFSFTDPAGKKWLTPKGHVVDGASIPRALWSLVGSPYTGEYRRASIVHDKACEDAAGNPKARRAADRMFYHACRAGGCSVKEAWILYLGVRIGALDEFVPAWQMGIEAGEAARPRAILAAAERKMEGDFRLATELLFKEPTSDDPKHAERQVDKVLSKVANKDLRRK